MSNKKSAIRVKGPSFTPSPYGDIVTKSKIKRMLRKAGFKPLGYHETKIADSPEMMWSKGTLRFTLSDVFLTSPSGGKLAYSKITTGAILENCVEVV